MAYDPYDWDCARENAARQLLLAQFDLDEFGYFNEVPVASIGECYVGECGIEYQAINPSDACEEPRYTFNDTATAERFITGSSLIGRIAPATPLLKRPKMIDLKCKVEGVIRIFTDFDNEGMTYPEVERIVCNDLNIFDLSIPVCNFACDNRNRYIKDFDVVVWQWDNYGVLIDGSVNPISSVLLQLNGQDRQSRRTGFWYDTVVPYMNFPDTPRDGINVFSFALNPVEHQPSGTCNFSRIDTAYLNLWFFEFDDYNCRGYADIFLNTNNHVRIYAVNYNVLRVMSGMAGLAYSN